MRAQQPPGRESSTLPWAADEISPFHNTDLRGTHRRLLKIAAFAHSDSQAGTTATSRVRLEPVWAPEETRGGRLRGAVGQNRRRVIPLRRRRDWAVSASIGI